MKIHKAQPSPLDIQKKEAIRMLKKDFCVPITEDDKANILSKKTEIQVEQCVSTILDRYYNGYYN